MPLSNIVNVQITRQTQSVSEAGFGTPLILGTSKRFNDVVREYFNLQGVAVDFNPYDLEYIAAEDIFAQPVTCPSILIGRRTVDTAGIEVETALPNQNYTVTINGNAVTVPSNTAVQDSVVTLSGVVTSVITFDANFVTGNSTVVTVNGTPLAAVPYDTSNAQTLTDIATAIAGAAGVTSAVSNGTNAITVVFVTAASAEINSAVTTGGASQPNATITYSGPLVTGNLINVSLNGNVVGTVTSKITYSTAFTAGTSTVTTVNGVALTAVLFDSSNAGTLTDIAAQLAGLPAVASAVSNGTDTVTVVFAAAGNNTVNSSVTTGGSTPTAAISQGGFVFATSSAATMATIAAAVQTALNTGFSPGIGTVVVSGVDSNIMSVNSNPNQAGIIDFFTVSLGASQPTAGIVNANQPTDANTIASALVAAINAFNDPVLGVTATNPSTPDGTLSISANVSGVPWTLAVSTDIQNPNQARVVITQAIPGQTYTVNLNGSLTYKNAPSFQFTAPATVQSNEQIALALVTAINSTNLLDANGNVILINGNPIPNPIKGTISANDNGNGSFEILGTPPFLIQAFPFEAMVVQKGLIVQPYVPSASVVTDIQAIQAVNDNWYALACTDRTVATVEAIAAYIETQIKIFGTASSDPNIINQPAGTDTTSVAAVFNNAGYARSFVLFSEEAAVDFPECAWFGAVLPLTPGSETWAFKMLASISTSDLSGTQESNAFAKQCNTYEYVGGVGITQRGTVAAGEYIDIIRGVDWLTSQIQTNVYNLLVNSPKVPYTDSGITSVEAQIRQALQLGIDNNFIASSPPYQIFVPTAASVSSNDKANRILRNVKFQATLAGAIQAIQINGTVSV